VGERRRRLGSCFVYYSRFGFGAADFSLGFWGGRDRTPILREHSADRDVMAVTETPIQSARASSSTCRSEPIWASVNGKGWRLCPAPTHDSTMTPKGDDRVRCHAYKEPHVVFAPIFCGRCQFSSCGTPSRANAQLDWPVGYEHEKRDIFRPNRKSFS
jgi:hypothetical protein